MRSDAGSARELGKACAFDRKKGRAASDWFAHIHRCAHTWLIVRSVVIV